MDGLKKALHKKLRQAGILDLAEAAWVVAEANKLAQGAYRVISFKEGVLAIEPQNTSQASQLYLESQRIIAAINQLLKKPLVTRIRFL